MIAMDRRAFFSCLIASCAAAATSSFIVTRRRRTKPKPKPKPSDQPVTDAIDFTLENCREARWDLVKRAKDIMEKDLVAREDDRAWNEIYKEWNRYPTIDNIFDVQPLPPGAAPEFPLDLLSCTDS